MDKCHPLKEFVDYLVSLDMFPLGMLPSQLVMAVVSCANNCYNCNSTSFLNICCPKIDEIVSYNGIAIALFLTGNTTSTFYFDVTIMVLKIHSIIFL